MGDGHLRESIFNLQMSASAHHHGSGNLQAQVVVLCERHGRSK